MRIEVDCERIKRNTEVIVKVCAERDIEVVGVTKACCGHPEVARAILAMGEQDLRIDGLRPKRPGVTMVGASSDHLIVDVNEADPLVRLGDELEFDPIYAAVATAMTSFGVTQVVKPIKMAKSC